LNWHSISQPRFSSPMLVPYAGLIACLFWNVIATTTAWIKGEGITKVCLTVISFIFLHHTLPY
jgi:hypothetical protein